MLNAGLVRPCLSWRGLVVAVVAAVAIVSWVADTSAWAVGLPDGRGYELVTPPDKNGGESVIDTGRIRVSSAGDALSFASLAGFGDARGTGISTEYMSLRDGAPGTNGWAAHAITPPQAPFTVNAAFHSLEPRYFGDFSADLSHGVFQAWSEIPGTPFAPNVADVSNLYVRSDLRTPGQGSYQLATNATSPMGTPGHPLGNLAQFSPSFDGASADFRHVVFETAYPLTPDSTAHADPLGGFTGPDVFNVFDASDGAVHLVGLVPPAGDTTCGAGGPACVAAASSIAGQGGSHGRYTERAVSADGSRVFFTDNSSTQNSTGALYMRVDDTTTVQLNASEQAAAPGPGTEPATFGSASADGSRVFFFTTEALTDDATGGSSKLYMYDTAKPASDAHNLTLIAADNEPADQGALAGVIGASADGRYVYFVAVGQLVAGAPILNGTDGIYVWHDDGTPGGAVSYVGELADANDEAKVIPLTYTLGPVQSRVSPDGKHLLFGSHSGVGLLSQYGGVDYDHGNSCGTAGSNACEELYVYDADARRLSCASCRPSGATATADASLTIAFVSEGGAETTPHFEQALSDDGRFAFFTSGEALVPQDTNGKLDAYEYDTRDGSVHLLSSGTDSSDSYFVGSSASGRDAFFATRARLVGWDTDSSNDMYDARVNGGFPEPAVPAPACGGEECHGPLGAAPSALSLGSTAVTHAGNVKPPVHRGKPKRKPLKCRRGFVRKRVHGKVRCVKKNSSHAARKAGRAAHRGGAR